MLPTLGNQALVNKTPSLSVGPRRQIDSLNGSVVLASVEDKVIDIVGSSLVTRSWISVGEGFRHRWYDGNSSPEVTYYSLALTAWPLHFPASRVVDHTLFCVVGGELFGGAGEVCTSSLHPNSVLCSQAE